MITRADVELLKTEFKEIFATKGELFELKEMFRNIQNTMDAFLKPLTKQEEDMIIMRYRMDRLENWADKAGPKIGLKLEH